MKSFLAASVTTLLLIATASADWVVDMKLESPQLTSDMQMKVKGDKLRADIPNGPLGAMSIVFDSATGDVLHIVHTQKMAMKANAEQTKQAMEMARRISGATNATPSKPQSSGQKEKFGGYDCDIWTWTEGANSGKFWVAANHPQAKVIKEIDKKVRNSPLGAAQTGPSMSDFPGVPIKSEVISGGGMKTTATILTVKEQNLDAKEFEAPEGFNVMTMPSAPAPATPPPGAPAPAAPAPGAAPAK